MWRALCQARGDCVLMIGHNPGIAAFAHQSVADHPDHDRFWDYPTGATLVVRFDVADWADARAKMGEAIDFVIPRSLLE